MYIVHVQTDYLEVHRIQGFCSVSANEFIYRVYPDIKNIGKCELRKCRVAPKIS